MRLYRGFWSRHFIGFRIRNDFSWKRNHGNSWLAPEPIPHEEVKRQHTFASDIYASDLVCYEVSYILIHLTLSNVVYSRVAVLRQSYIRGCANLLA